MSSRQRLVDTREDERDRIARDLHDGPLQHLSKLSVAIGESDLSQKIQKGCRSISEEIRDICMDLRIPTLAAYGLGPAARDLAHGFARQHPDILVQIDIPRYIWQVEDRVARTYYRVLQELLANVANHASAKTVWIQMTGPENAPVITLRDDGVGFEAPSELIYFERDGHLGLSFASQRAEASGVDLAISSSPGHGTTATLSLATIPWHFPTISFLRPWKRFA